MLLEMTLILIFNLKRSSFFLISGHISSVSPVPQARNLGIFDSFLFHRKPNLSPLPPLISLRIPTLAQHHPLLRWRQQPPSVSMCLSLWFRFHTTNYSTYLLKMLQYLSFSLKVKSKDVIIVGFLQIKYRTPSSTWISYLWNIHI